MDREAMVLVGVRARGYRKATRARLGRIDDMVIVGLGAWVVSSIGLEESLDGDNLEEMAMASFKRPQVSCPQV